MPIILVALTGQRPKTTEHEMKYSLQPRLSFFLVAVFLIAGSFSVQAQDSMQRWQNFDFSKSALRSADVAGIPLEDLKLMRGIVFGRHGRVFKDAEIRVFLEAQD